MNIAEKIVQTYLRLNGFFSLPYFSVLQDTGTHVDFLAIRISNSVEKVGKSGDQVSLSIDMSFLDELGVTPGDTIGLVVEVKGGNESAMVSNGAFDYVRPFFGKATKLCKVGFEEKEDEITKRGDHVIVPLAHCMDFIVGRFDEMERIDRELRGSGRLTKVGSWHLSEEFLSDLLFLKKSGFDVRRQSELS